jgi:uncharacterized protein YecT (DUF1311 family)
MKRYMSLFICLLSLILPSTLNAGDASDSELHRLNTALKEAMTQADMNVASKKIGDFWDAKLVLIERQIETKLDHRQLKSFSKSKRRWQSYRSQEVKFLASFAEGGSIQPLVANTSYSQLTAHRVMELKGLFGESLEGCVDRQKP